MDRSSTPRRPAYRQSLFHDAVDVGLQALHEAQRSLARAPLEYLARSGALTPQAAAMGRWHEAMLRTAFSSLIAGNRYVGALAAHALTGSPAGRRPPR